ncbi:GNAT family N-acetyltransferase [Dyadobacter sp. CY345]|uniref:GNAT family N-acetyltransferase n=1 Tax=Dyadobacter sp. CY345 TaxID=2909335 RepID=UPI001F210BE5|nr:GNAT family N-acetyltransferase [Dyadobacter sp. CY345]MCF2446793.1 GNAT family N-acetyltransferase [Dyadobacter sp. CY345]
MNNDQYQKLDNPVWHSLQSSQKSFALGSDLIKRYPPDILTFLGCEAPQTGNLDHINQWIKPGENFFVVGELPKLSSNWKLNARLDCVQMVCNELNFDAADGDNKIVPLTQNHREEMLELVNLVQPGYFFKNTPLLGDYFGIMQDDKLVAMAGERMKMNGFTEISAVVTHPQHTGKGYAKQLVAHVSQKNIEQKAVPFLHFVTSNIRAGKVYEILGYTERRIIPFWQIQYKG